MARSAAHKGAVSLQDTIRSAAAELPADTIARIAAALAPALAQPAANQPQRTTKQLRVALSSCADGLLVIPGGRPVTDAFYAGQLLAITARQVAHSVGVEEPLNAVNGAFVAALLMDLSTAFYESIETEVVSV
ncbi:MULTISPECIES: hypothetical protein [Xanthomonas]|uniref:Uncharacterized protein n=2 Tax=Xanthomonas citri TaxID=346 RepID=A0AB33CIV4_XANCI|nr:MULTISPECIES: hypothetical protein [Xanthomonas]MBV6780943.1 hypothetical protein [Xanthomonas campestris pv. trichodesmae]ASK91860.1 hypothetical protein XcvCFBP7111P_10385 [Xanthomonas citri pv. vignicola]MBV6788467.1 hypothetical protein [Xanthomonas campestris pv. clerodendri]MBZ3919217.1 hypothetical protein [Xanthomonas campestris pv. trichodesmae]MBZ3922902.1 hypothetical protein [Xanthomonas citri pv. sesbaniae]